MPNKPGRKKSKLPKKVNIGVSLSKETHEKLRQLADLRADRSASAEIELLIKAVNLGKLEFIK